MSSTASSDERINIVIAVDGSDHSQNALRWYMRLLYKPEFTLVLIHCVEPLSVIGEVTSPDGYENILEDSKRGAEKIEKMYQDILTQHNVKGNITTIYGNRPGEVLVETAKQENAAMIVVGSRGLSKVRRTILGSVSDFLVHHAHCPVIVCRDPNTQHFIE